MHSAKKFAKKLLPKTMRQPILNVYHLGEAIAANARYGFPTRGMKVIMITGTNGKTTTASLVGQMLINAGYKVGINTTAYYSYGSETFVKEGSRTLEDVMTQQKMFAKMKQAGCDFVVLEATSQGLEQNRLWGVDCDVAVMTNLTQDHLDYHGTMQDYAAAKARLFAARPRVIVLNADDKWFDYFNKFEASERKVTYGKGAKADFKISEVEPLKNGTDIILNKPGGGNLKIYTHLIGGYNAYNVAAAAIVGHFEHLTDEQITQGIASLQSVPGRLEHVEAGQPFEVIIDYAHTPDALQNVLSTLREVTKGRLILVFGATGDRDRAKRPIMGTIAAKLADKIFVTDEETYTEDGAEIRKAIWQGVKKENAEQKATEIADRREAIKAAIAFAKKGDTVVITGMGHELARNMGGKLIEWNDAAVARELLEEK